jgi:hypothetical protein
MNRKPQKAIVWFTLCFTLVLGLLTTLGVAGIITLRLFGILCLAAIIIFAILISRVIRKASLLSATTEARLGPSKRKRLFVLSATLVWLIFAAWLTRGEPWFPRLIGAAVVIAFAAPFAMTKREGSNSSQ